MERPASRCSTRVRGSSLRLSVGIGAGLTIDEFALWVHLDDVYWAKEGRSSIDAAVIAAAGMLLVLFGGRPFERTTGSAVEVIAGAIVGAILLALAAICFVKQRVLHGAVGLFLPDRSLRRRPDWQAGVALGKTLLRGARPRQAGESRGALPARPTLPTTQGALSRRGLRGDERSVPGEARRASRNKGGRLRDPQRAERMAVRTADGKRGH